MVKAKFRCMKIEHAHVEAEGECAATVNLVPVWTGYKGENASWSKYTPSGSLQMLITNPAAIADFELGRDYFLTFEQAPAVINP